MTPSNSNLLEIQSFLAPTYDFKQHFTNKFEFTKALLNKVQKLSYSNINKQNLFDYTKILDQVLTKVVEINKEDLLKEFLIFLIKSLSHFSNAEEYNGYSLQILKSFNLHYSNPQFKSLIQENAPIIIFELEKSKNKFFKNHIYYIFRCFCNELIKLYKIVDIDTEQLQYQIGLSYHLEAINQQDREKKSMQVKASFLEMAEKHYKDKCQNIELSKDLRPLIKACYGFIFENELSEFTYNTPITSMLQTELYHYKRMYMDDLKQELLLKHMSVDTFLLPHYDCIKKDAKEIYEQSIIGKLGIALAPMNEKRKLDSISNETEHLNYQIIDFYNLNLQMIWNMRLFPIFIGMMEKYRLTQSSIMHHLSQWELIDQTRLPIISKAIDRFFQNDYISSIHILVPQIEHQIRYMFEMIGYSTTNTPKGKSQEEQTLSAFLREEFVIKKLGIAVTKYFEILFTTKIGLNIRNNIAHGFLESKKFNLGFNIIIIYSLILLTRFRPQKQN